MDLAGYVLCTVPSLTLDENKVCDWSAQICRQIMVTWTSEDLLSRIIGHKSGIIFSNFTFVVDGH